MCLEIKKNQKPLIAEEDIICYKVLFARKSEKGNNIYRSYYRHTAVVLGKTYKANFTYDSRGNILQGLHSIVDKDNITRLRSNGYFSSFEIKIIVKCIIPKGSYYYLGVFDKSDDSYASTELRYTKEIVLYFR